jgi:hypothetical protein
MPENTEGRPNPHVELAIELVYDVDCPSVDRARDAIRDALATLSPTLDLPAHWTEWTRGDPSTPAALRMLGSPSVLVNGWDVESGGLPPAPDADANSCRIYRGACGCACGAPPAELIATAIVSAIARS